MLTTLARTLPPPYHQAAIHLLRERRQERLSEIQHNLKTLELKSEKHMHAWLSDRNRTDLVLDERSTGFPCLFFGGLQFEPVLSDRRTLRNYEYGIASFSE